MTSFPVVMVNSSDRGGGAEKVASDLLRMYREKGWEARLLVGRREGHQPGVFQLPQRGGDSSWEGFWFRVHDVARTRALRWKGAGTVAEAARILARPQLVMERRRGMEDFHHPGSHLLAKQAGNHGILHLHNLHGGYFDLSALPALSQTMPVVLTLHDTWMLAGHCAYAMGCQRWRTGCGSCPDLTLYPAIPRDATAENFARKREIYRKSHLFVSTPSHWALEQVNQSMLAPGVVEGRVIANGVDLAVFQPGTKKDARSALNLPQDRSILLYVANRARRNPFKDYPTLRGAVARLGESSKGHLLFLALGDEGPSEHIGRAEVRFLPFQDDPRRVALHYRASDLYLHAARADTFPTTILEAMACGLPVVATAVGGIPEQVRSLQLPGITAAGTPSLALGEATGILVPPGDAPALAAATLHLLEDPLARTHLGEAAASIARRCYSLSAQADVTLDWYRDVRRQWEANPPSSLGMRRL